MNTWVCDECASANDDDDTNCAQCGHEQKHPRRP